MPIGVRLENVSKRVRNRFAFGRDPAGQYFVEHAAERPDDAPRVGQLAAGILMAVFSG